MNTYLIQRCVKTLHDGRLHILNTYVNASTPESAMVTLQDDIRNKGVGYSDKLAIASEVMYSEIIQIGISVQGNIREKISKRLDTQSPDTQSAAFLPDHMG